MHELSPDRFADALPLLHGLPINHLFARSVLEAQVDGRVWVDTPADPALLYVAHPCGMSLLTGTPHAAALPALRALLLDRERERDEWLQASPGTWNDALAALFGCRLATQAGEPGGSAVQRFARSNFRFDAARHAQLCANLPSSNPVRIEALDARRFESLEFSVTPRHFWRDFAAFRATGSGYCTLVGTQPTASAFSAFVIDGQLEIGIETHPDWRGRGHALAACIALIGHCLENGLEPVWSCRRENTGSRNLATRLGFVPTLELPYYRLPAC